MQHLVLGLDSKIVIGDDGYRGTGSVMAHQLVKLYPLQGCAYWLNM